VRFPNPSELNSPKYFLTSFQVIESAILTILNQDNPASIQDVYSIGPLSGSELSIRISKRSGRCKTMTFPMDLVLKFIFHTPFYDKLLNLSQGMKTTPVDD